MPLAKTACELMFQVIADRAEKAALIDRLTDLAHIITMGTNSHRFRRIGA